MQRNPQGSEKQKAFQAIIEEITRIRRARESACSPMVGTTDFNAQRRAEGMEYDQEALERVLTSRHARILAGNESASGGDGWDGDRTSALVSEQQPAIQMEHNLVGHRTKGVPDTEFLPVLLFPIEEGCGLLSQAVLLLKK